MCKRCTLRGTGTHTSSRLPNQGITPAAFTSSDADEGLCNTHTTHTGRQSIYCRLQVFTKGIVGLLVSSAAATMAQQLRHSRRPSSRGVVPMAPPTAPARVAFGVKLQCKGKSRPKNTAQKS